MVGHEIFGLLGTIVIGAIVIASFKNNSGTSAVIGASTDGFAKLINAMTQSGSTTGAGTSGG